MEDIITLSSDEEEYSPPAKKKKVVNNDFHPMVDCIVLSDEEECFVENNLGIVIENVRTLEPDEFTINDSDDEELKAEQKQEDESLEVENSVEIDNDNEVIMNNTEIDNDNEVIMDKSTEAQSAKVSLNSNLNSTEPHNNNELADKTPIAMEEADKDQLVEASSSKTEELDDINEIMANFINTCHSLAIKPGHKNVVLNKTDTFKRLIQKVSKECCHLEHIKKLITKNLENVKADPAKMIVYFSEVYQEAKHAYDTRNSNIDPKKKKIIKKLDHTLCKLRNKIRELESAECNWDDENNSSYMKMQRYRERAAQVYKKFCEYVNEDPHYGDILYTKLDFSKSDYTEINRAINRKYRNNGTFPTYYEIDKLIRRCIERHNLKLSEAAIVTEVKMCFKELGILLQRRRKINLHQIHSYYIDDGVDPAKNSPELDNKLRMSSKQREDKINEICQKYTRLQEMGAEPEYSDGDKNSVTSGSDENEGKTD